MFKKFKNIFLIFIIIILLGSILIIVKNKYDAGNGIDDSIGALSSNDKKGDFEKVYYYNKNNLIRYKDYEIKNPDLSTEDVVWMVNASIDKGFYNDAEEINISKSNILLVNKNHKLADDFVPKNLIETSSGNYLTKETYDAFEEMREDALRDGYILGVASGYRSISSQKYIYNNYLTNDSQEVVDTYSARPGYSEHHTGEAIDLIGSFGSINEFEQTKESKWVKDNAYKYGFIIRYKEGYEDITGYEYEPWHIRYVGTHIASDMRDKNINTLEEYYEKYIKD